MNVDSANSAPSSSGNHDDVDQSAKPVTLTARRPWLVPVAIVAGLVIFFVAGFQIYHALGTVSTDDAYVNGHVTLVAPRVTGQVQRVFVEDNNRVKRDDVLVQLDPEPYRIKVATKQAAVDIAQANFAVAEAQVRGLVAKVRAQRFKLEHAIEEVDNQIALLRQRVATWEQNNATLALAQTEFDRAKQLRVQKVVSAEEFDRKREALDVAKARVAQALEAIYQQRVALGLPAQPSGKNRFADVPVGLDQTFSSVRQALAELIESASQLGIVSSSFDLTPKEAVAEFYKRDPSGDIDKIYAEIIKNAPGLRQARAALEKTQRDLDQAKLDLRYCTIVAEIDGVITRRNVNPGNNVQVGQNLMAIRSIYDIWVDANFKETQLRHLRIGQHVEIKADMYGDQRTFEGRLSGFTMGTGSTLALLPPQNATGNFIKVVQRLPVRIDFVNYDPEKAPLFIGLSVIPVVDVRSKPTGPNAGKFLQAPIAPDHP